MVLICVLICVVVWGFFGWSWRVVRVWEVAVDGKGVRSWDEGRGFVWLCCAET